MIRTRSANLVAFMACGFASFAAERTAFGADLLVDSSTIVLFSALDGSSDDEDGAVDGILTLSSLIVTASGQIVIDVPSATVSVSGPVSLDGSASISTDATDLPATGPTLVIVTDDSITLAGSSRIVADGAEVGGAVFLCAGQRIELCGTTSTIAAGGLGAGGSIHLEAAEVIRLISGASNISANGVEGGTISMVACGVNGETVPPTCGGDDEIDEDDFEDDFEDGSVAAALWINGHVEATGSDGMGGTIELFARQGSIKLSRKRNRIVASGSEGDGSITLTAATTLEPDPPKTDPPATLITDSPSLEVCDCIDISMTIDTPESLSLTNLSDVDVSGTIIGNPVSVEVNGIPGVIEGGTYVVTSVPLSEGSNTLSALALDLHGHLATANVQVVRDTTPPVVVIASPQDNTKVFSAQVSVAGLINDTIVGVVNPEPPTCVVNGVEVAVVNNAFVQPALILVPGNNIIEAIATDQAGNVGTTSIQVEFDDEAVRKAEVFSGTNQSAGIGETCVGPAFVARATWDRRGASNGSSRTEDIIERRASLNFGRIQAVRSVLRGLRCAFQ